VSGFAVPVPDAPRVELHRFDGHAEVWIYMKDLHFKMMNVAAVNVEMGTDRVLLAVMQFHASAFEVIDHREPKP
jgi:hypothetical protein